MSPDLRVLVDSTCRLSSSRGNADYDVPRHDVIYFNAIIIIEARCVFLALIKHFVAHADINALFVCTRDK